MQIFTRIVHNCPIRYDSTQKCLRQSKNNSLFFAHWLIMGRSQKWPNLRSLISKIQDIRFVGTDDLILFRKFHNFPWNIVAVARWESYFVVGSLDLTWWPDLTWPWAEIFTKVAEKMGGKVGENPAALRAAVFSLSLKNLRGGVQTPPPSRARVKLAIIFQGMFLILWEASFNLYCMHMFTWFVIFCSDCSPLFQGVSTLMWFWA